MHEIQIYQVHKPTSARHHNKFTSFRPHKYVSFLSSLAWWQWETLDYASSSAFCALCSYLCGEVVTSVIAGRIIHLGRAKLDIVRIIMVIGLFLVRLLLLVILLLCRVCTVAGRSTCSAGRSTCSAGIRCTGICGMTTMARKQCCQCAAPSHEPLHQQ